MITLTLLHPVQHSPIQSWTFADKSAIQIGRATDNQIVLYSAVVSRHHVELRQVNGGWEVVNLGTNGTYVDDQSISQVPVVDGLVIRLARSGPQLQIRLGEVNLREGMDKTLHEPLSKLVAEHPKETLIGGSEINN